MEEQSGGKVEEEKKMGRKEVSWSKRNRGRKRSPQPLKA